MVSPEDLELLTVTDDVPEDAVQTVLDRYEERCATTTDADASSLSVVELRDLPSVDELARGVDDPLAVDAAREPCSTGRARRSAPAPSPAT